MLTWERKKERVKRRRVLVDTLSTIRPPAKLTVSQWADKYRVLPRESSAESGKWDTSRAPYQRGIMDAFLDPLVEEVVLMTSAQVGKTEIILNICGFFMHLDPSPILIVHPNVTPMAEAFSKDRLAPTIASTPALRGLLKDPKSRDSGNTILHKEFPGGRLTIAGANSAASLAQRPVRIVLCDDVDRFPASAGTEGDPVALAQRRAQTFWNKKFLLASTPTDKDLSRIEEAYEESDKRRYYIPCRHCGEMQTLKWAQVRWQSRKDCEQPIEGTGRCGKCKGCKAPKKHRPDTARYHCEGCDEEWTDADRLWSVERGEWYAEAEFHKRAGFWLNALYSPWVMLADVVDEWLRKHKNPKRRREFINTVLAEVYDETGERPDWEQLTTRKESWADEVPQGVCVLTAGCDIQDDRIEIETLGWGPGEENWSIEYKFLYGDPEKDEIWKELDEFLKKRYQHESGLTLPIAAACIDSGHKPKKVHKFVQGKSKRRIFAIRGSSTPGAPTVGKVSRANKLRVPVMYLGTDTIKGTVYSYLQETEIGPGYCHFPQDRDREYFLGLTAEKAVIKYRKGFKQREWHKIRERNEPLDCRVYNHAALEILQCDLDKLAQALVVKAEKRERQSPEPTTHEPSAVPRAVKRARRRSGGWVNGWRQ